MKVKRNIGIYNPCKMINWNLINSLIPFIQEPCSLIQLYALLTLLTRHETIFVSINKYVRPYSLNQFNGLNKQVYSV